MLKNLVTRHGIQEKNQSLRVCMLSSAGTEAAIIQGMPVGLCMHEERSLIVVPRHILPGCCL